MILHLLLCYLTCFNDLLESTTNTYIICYHPSTCIASSLLRIIIAGALCGTVVVENASRSAMVSSSVGSDEKDGRGKANGEADQHLLIHLCTDCSASEWRDRGRWCWRGDGAVVRIRCSCWATRAGGSDGADSVAAAAAAASTCSGWRGVAVCSWAVRSRWGYRGLRSVLLVVSIFHHIRKQDGLRWQCLSATMSSHWTM